MTIKTNTTKEAFNLLQNQLVLQELPVEVHFIFLLWSENKTNSVTENSCLSQWEGRASHSWSVFIPCTEITGPFTYGCHYKHIWQHARVVMGRYRCEGGQKVWISTQTLMVSQFFMLCPTQWCHRHFSAHWVLLLHEASTVLYPSPRILPLLQCYIV